MTQTEETKEGQRGRVPVNRLRRRAYILILIGIIFPLSLLPFLSGYKAGAGWFSNLMNLKIALGLPFAIPYRFVLAFAILLIFVVLRQLELLRHRDGQD
jgi:hypothetical protein